MYTQAEREAFFVVFQECRSTTIAARELGFNPATCAQRLLVQAKEQGVSLTGPGSLLNQLTKDVLETALNAELTEHLGHQHGGVPLESHMRNGTRTKAVLTEIGPVEIEVPNRNEVRPIHTAKRLICFMSGEVCLLAPIQSRTSDSGQGDERDA